MGDDAVNIDNTAKCGNMFAKTSPGGKLATPYEFEKYIAAETRTEVGKEVDKEHSDAFLKRTKLTEEQRADFTNRYMSDGPKRSDRYANDLAIFLNHAALAKKVYFSGGDSIIEPAYCTVDGSFWRPGDDKTKGPYYKLSNWTKAEFDEYFICDEKAGPNSKPQQNDETPEKSHTSWWDRWGKDVIIGAGAFAVGYWIGHEKGEHKYRSNYFPSYIPSYPNNFYSTRNGFDNGYSSFPYGNFGGNFGYNNFPYYGGNGFQITQQQLVPPDAINIYRPRSSDTGNLYYQRFSQQAGGVVTGIVGNPLRQIGPNSWQV
jgi:hypothetical protein